MVELVCNELTPVVAEALAVTVRRAGAALNSALKCFYEERVVPAVGISSGVGEAGGERLWLRERQLPKKSFDSSAASIHEEAGGKSRRERRRGQQKPERQRRDERPGADR
jgi:hypothetical protein